MATTPRAWGKSGDAIQRGHVDSNGIVVRLSISIAKGPVMRTSMRLILVAMLILAPSSWAMARGGGGGGGHGGGGGGHGGGGHGGGGHFSGGGGGGMSARSFNS